MPDRVYVKVTSDFDPTGYMKPRSIAWPDGRCFRIDDVRSFRPFDGNRTLDCYTVVIHGKERRLFFEHGTGPFSCSPGRWFVESSKSLIWETTPMLQEPAIDKR